MSDKELRKRIGAYLGVSGINAEDVAHIRKMVAPGPSETDPQPVGWDHVSDIHRIIRDHLPTSSELADARMYDAARAIAALATPPRRALSWEEIEAVRRRVQGYADSWSCWLLKDNWEPSRDHAEMATSQLQHIANALDAILSAQSQATVTNGSGTANEGG